MNPPEQPSSAPPTLPPNPTVSEWARLAENDPAKLKDAIKGATLDDLDQLAKKILEKHQLQINNNVREAIAERKRNLEADKSIDTSLETLESRLYLAQLLEIRSPAKEEPSTLDSMVAGSLRWVGEKTKDLWGMKALSEGLRNLKGRDLERSFYNFLAFFGKMGQAIPGVSYLPIGLVLKYGERRVVEMDIQDTINEKRFAGEKITFAGISSAEWDRWSALNAEKTRTGQPIQTLPELTKTYIDSLRRENYLQSKLAEPLNLSFAAIIDQKGRETVVKSLENDRKKQDMAAAWKPAQVETLTFDKNTASAVKQGEKWKITVPEDQLDENGTPKNATSAKTLNEAIQQLTQAKEITVADESANCTFNLIKKSASIPRGAEITLAHNLILKDIHKDRIREVELEGKGGKLPTRPLTAQLENGKFLIGSNSDWAAAVPALSSFIGLDSANNGDLFEYSTSGGWKAKPSTTPVRPT
jgi:hypothetical protein